MPPILTSLLDTDACTLHMRQGSAIAFTRLRGA
ncbi:hypothetical protein DEU50_1077 [Aeromonas salmonicida]|uniref:Uncharacterized protein n=1 Tax=Aeromonas salmonicida TaxID=645 RepID=A0AAX1PIY9_AERSA|nr:hypothetical protein DEU50_1077 [Aeromonas salmonicida]